MNKNQLLALLLPVAFTTHAQFSDDWIQNERYWNSGKAEFNIYEASMARYDALHPAEVIHILVREPFDPRQGVKPEGTPGQNAITVLKFNQIVRIQTGVYVYQQMHSNFWDVAKGDLLKFTLTSNDSCGNTFKLGRRETIAAPDAATREWRYEYHTYWDGMAEGNEKLAIPAGAVFYDELPMRVRTIDFRNAPLEFSILLAGSVVNSKRDSINFQPATVRTAPVENGKRVVTVTHSAGTDRFTVGEAFPHLLWKWEMADGSRLNLKRSLKIDYWNHHNPGDLERVLQDRQFKNLPPQ
jgi:hypothetical protein